MSNPSKRRRLTNKPDLPNYAVKKHLLCGHVGEKYCPELCDDFVKKEAGLCYLIGFEDRDEALEMLGYWPTVAEIFLYIIRHNPVVLRFALKSNYNGTMHMTLETNEREANFMFIGCCSQCEGSVTKFMIYYRTNFLCKECRVPLNVTIMPLARITCDRVGVDTSRYHYPQFAPEVETELFERHKGSKYQLPDVLENLAVDPMDEFYEISPDRSELERLRRLEAVDSYVKDYAVITRRTRTEYANQAALCRMPKLRFTFDRFRHDYVGHNADGSMRADIRLEELGVPIPDGDKSPDYADKEKKSVLELATSISDNHLLKTAKEKKEKYQLICEGHDIKLYVIVVGPNKIICNFKIEREIALELIRRNQEAIDLYYRGGHRYVGAKSVFVRENKKEYELADNIFREIKLKPLVSNDYNIEEIMSFNEDMTQEELIEVRDIMDASLREADKPSSKTESEIVKYLSKFTPKNTKTGPCMMKRICNMPMVYPSVKGKHITCLNRPSFAMPEDLQYVWQQAVLHQLPETEDVQETVRKAKENILPEVKHLNKNTALFSINPNKDVERLLALKGIGGLKYEDDFLKKQKEDESKKSFHPVDVEVGDIKDFINTENFGFYNNHFISDELEEIVTKSKKISTNHSIQESLNLVSKVNNTKLITHAYFMTYIFTELSYSYKHWTDNMKFMKKELKYGVTMLIYNPKDYIFVSFAIPKDEYVNLETGRLGPELYDTKTHVITDFCSFNESELEHFLKFGPYMAAMTIHTMSFRGTDTDKITSYVNQVMNNIYLIYSNNKTDVEELITSQRYLYMKLFEAHKPNHWGFVDRLPKVLRSRLASHYTKKVIGDMKYYGTERMERDRKYVDGVLIHGFKNIKSLFYDGFVSYEEKINEFYYGYVVSKYRSMNQGRMFKTLSKIIEHEYEFREDINRKMFTKGLKTPKFSSNRSLLKGFASAMSQMLDKKLGENSKHILYEKYIERVVGSSFSQLATLKASSRNHDKPVLLSKTAGAKESKKASLLLKELNADNPDEASKRPKMILALTTLVENYKKSANREPDHLIELLPFCLDSLLEKEGFDSDCFAKSQHGGDREIHVLEVSARIVQFHIELLSRVMCEEFESETICTPKTKENFVYNHHRKSKMILGDSYVTYGKSADASKWCQLHHVSHFAAMFRCVAPPILHNFLITALSLWTRKKISFPLGLLSIIHTNRNNITGKLFKKFSNDSSSNQGMFSTDSNSKIEVKSGMFQGILHLTSSLYHTMVQENFKEYCERYMGNKLKKDSFVTTVVQGSDDSGMLISISGTLTWNKQAMIKSLLLWKEKVSKHLSIETNDSKTSVGTIDMIEYNSEWNMGKKAIKPVFRWASACFELSVTEKFIDRFRIFNNGLTQCLEGGATTLECASMQICQMYLHYILMGFNNHDSLLVREATKLMIENPDPSTGFMPADYDMVAGVTGVEFQLYNLALNTTYGQTLEGRVQIDTNLELTDDTLPKQYKKKSSTMCKLKFSNTKIFERTAKEIGIMTLEDANMEAETNPILLLDKVIKWPDTRPLMVLKLHSPGVRESIANVSPMLRMAASSSYMLNMPCFSVPRIETDEQFAERMKRLKTRDELLERGIEADIPDEDKPVKYTLIALLLRNREIIRTNSVKQEDLNTLFPMVQEFRVVLETINMMMNNFTKEPISMSKSSKRVLTVFPKETNDYPLIELCKRKWFSIGRVNVPEESFVNMWEKMMIDFPFLTKTPGIDGFRQTQDILKMTAVETVGFLQSLNTRARKVKLSFSNAKSDNLAGTLSRIYWQNTKLRYDTSPGGDIQKLRSSIFSTITYWDIKASKENEIEEMLVSDRASFLDANHLELPTKAKRLKKMRDFLKFQRGEDIDIQKILGEMKMDNNGTLGAFIIDQPHYGRFGSVGYGKWKGNLNNNVAEVEMNNNTITRITLQHVMRPISDGLSLIELIKGFHANLDSNSEDGFKLTTGGIIHNGVGTLVVVDPLLRAEELENLDKKAWRIRVEGTSIKLKVVNFIGSRGKKNEIDYKKQQDGESSGGVSQELTVLVERFNAHDWSEEAHESKESIMKTAWFNGIACSMKSFTMFGKRAGESKEHFRNNLKRGKTDYKHFAKTFNKCFGFDEADSAWKRSQEEYQVQELIRRERESRMSQAELRAAAAANLRAANERQAQIDRANQASLSMFDDFSKALDNGLHNDLEAEPEVEDVPIGLQSMNTYTGQDDLSFHKEQAISAWSSLDMVEREIILPFNTMPNAHRFFSTLNQYCFNNLNLSCRDVVLALNRGDLRNLPEPISGLFSIILDRYIPSDILDDEQSVVSMVSDYQRKLGADTEIDIDTITIKEIDQNISILEEYISRLAINDSSSRHSLKTILNRYKRLKTVKSQDHDQYNKSFRDVVLNVMRAAEKNNSPEGKALKNSDYAIPFFKSLVMFNGLLKKNWDPERHTRMCNDMDDDRLSADVLDAISQVFRDPDVDKAMHN